VPTEPERDPVEWAQHTALVAISVARTVLDLAEAAVADRDRLERLATSGRSFAETWLGDAARVASTVVSGFGFETEAKPSAPPAAPTPAREPAPAQPGLYALTSHTSTQWLSYRLRCAYVTPPAVQYGRHARRAVVLRRRRRGRVRCPRLSSSC